MEWTTFSCNIISKMKGILLTSQSNMAIESQTRNLTEEQKNLLKIPYANHLLVQKIPSQISMEKLEDILLPVLAVTFQEIVSKYLTLDTLKRPRH